MNGIIVLELLLGGVLMSLVFGLFPNTDVIANSSSKPKHEPEPDSPDSVGAMTKPDRPLIDHSPVAHAHPGLYLGIGLSALVFFGGCESTPTVTRTGDVKDIVIGNKLSAPDVSVNPGDEVRWINKRTAAVRIIFLDPVLKDKLSCRNNLGGWMSQSDTVKLATNETASACFRDPGYFRYTVRMESGLTTSEINVPGAIQVGGTMGDAAAQTSEQSKGRAISQVGDQLSEPEDGQSSGKRNVPPGTTSTTTTTTTTPAN